MSSFFVGVQPTKKLLISWQFSGPYGVTKYGSGWRKNVINQCLEFVLEADSGRKIPCPTRNPNCVSICLRFLSCAEMLMHVIAHRGSMDTIQVCIGSWLGKKSLVPPGTQTVSIAPGFSVRCSTNWAIPTSKNWLMSSPHHHTDH